MTEERRDWSTRPWASSESLLSWPEFMQMPQEQRMALPDSKIGQAVAHVTLICPSQKLWVGAEDAAERWLPLWNAELAKRRATAEPERSTDLYSLREVKVPQGLSFVQWLTATATIGGAVSSPTARDLMRRTLAYLADCEGDVELLSHTSGSRMPPETTGSD